MRQAQINVRTRACSRTSIARTKQAALTHNVRGKELKKNFSHVSKNPLQSKYIYYQVIIFLINGKVLTVILFVVSAEISRRSPSRLVRRATAVPIATKVGQTCRPRRGRGGRMTSVSGKSWRLPSTSPWNGSDWARNRKVRATIAVFGARFLYKFTVIGVKFCVRAYLEGCRETETPIFAACTSLPVSGFQTWQVWGEPITLFFTLFTWLCTDETDAILKSVANLVLSWILEYEYSKPYLCLTRFTGRSYLRSTVIQTYIFIKACWISA